MHIISLPHVPQVCRARIAELLQSEGLVSSWDETTMQEFLDVLEDRNGLTHPVLYTPADKFDKIVALEHIYAQIARMWCEGIGHRCGVDIDGKDITLCLLQYQARNSAATWLTWAVYHPIHGYGLDETC
jgi:hypothetical protein